MSAAGVVALSDDVSASDSSPRAHVLSEPGVMLESAFPCGDGGAKCRMRGTSRERDVSAERTLTQVSLLPATELPLPHGRGRNNGHRPVAFVVLAASETEAFAQPLELRADPFAAEFPLEPGDGIGARPRRAVVERAAPRHVRRGFGRRRSRA